GCLARQRIFRIPAKRQRAKARVERIVDKKPPRKARARACDFLDDFKRLKRTDNVRQCADDTRFLTGGYGTGRRRLANEIAVIALRLSIRTALECTKHCDLPLELPDRRRDKRHFCEVAGIIYQK